MKTIFFAKVSLKLLGIVALLDITKNLILPKLSLLLLICGLMLVDLATGILRSKFQGQRITSDRLRHSVVKFLQYFGSIGLVVVLSNQNTKNEQFQMVMTLARDGVSLLIIYIESLSIFENLYAMDKTTPFARYFIRPIYWALTLAIKKNSIQDAGDKMKEDMGKKDEKDEEEAA